MGKRDWKIENAIQMRVWVRVRARNNSTDANSMGELGAPDTEKHRNSNKTIHNAQQCTAGYGAKRLINLIRFYRSYPCFC